MRSRVKAATISFNYFFRSVAFDSLLGRISEQFYNVFSKKFVYFTMPRHRLRHSSQRITIPIMFRAVPD